MNDNDDKLLEQFFSEKKQTIADNGFSARVMHRLPGRNNKLASILASFGIILSIILFFLFDGIHVILGFFRDVFVSVIQNNATTLDLKTLAIAGAVLLFMGVRKIYTME
jgi:hypothetical protein